MTFSTEPGSPEHRLYLRQLAIYLRKSRKIRSAWDAHSNEHTNPNTHQPHDENAWARRRQQRDADTLSAFGRVYHHADELVDVAQQQLAQLPTSERTERYARQVRELREATQRLYAVHEDWRALHRALPETSKPGTKAFEEPLAESYADAFSYLDQWASQGQALFAVDALAQRQSKPSSPASTATLPVPKAAATSSATRRQRP